MHSKLAMVVMKSHNYAVWAQDMKTLLERKELW